MSFLKSLNAPSNFSFSKGFHLHHLTSDRSIDHQSSVQLVIGGNFVDQHKKNLRFQDCNDWPLELLTVASCKIESIDQNLNIFDVPNAQSFSHQLAKNIASSVRWSIHSIWSQHPKNNQMIVNKNIDSNPIHVPEGIFFPQSFPLVQERFPTFNHCVLDWGVQDMVWNFITPKGPINYTPKDDVLQIWPLGGTHHSWPCHTWLSALCLHHHLLSTLGMQQEWFTLSMQRTPDRILNHEITLHPIAMQTVMQLPIGSCGHRYYEGKRIIFHEGEKKTQAFQSSLDILSDGTQKLPFIHFDEQMPFKKCLNFFQEEESTSYLLMDALFDELHQWYIFYWKIKN